MDGTGEGDVTNPPFARANGCANEALLDARICSTHFRTSAFQSGFMIL